MSLQGYVSFTGGAPLINWKLYSGPGTVSFSNASVTNTTTTFNSAGTYTLMLSADDSVHAVAYDAVVINVTTGITLTGKPSGQNLTLTWTGGSPPYTIESATSLTAVSWSTLLTTNSLIAQIPMAAPNAYFRIRSQ